jgi:hypothetical protein
VADEWLADNLMIVIISFKILSLTRIEHNARTNNYTITAQNYKMLHFN